MTSTYHKIIRNVFPRGYCLAFAYGSGVFKQLGHVSIKNNMMDFIVAVENPAEWHKENLLRNPSHYSFLKYGGPENITKFQNLLGAKVYFNTLVPTYFGIVKYGVVSRECLISDLLDWDTLYLAGRLHKPVYILHQDSKDDELRSALKINLYAALHVALLLLPEMFSEHNLYKAVANISYSGDFRMLFGEDRNKVNNIVMAQLNEFRILYSPILRELKEYVIVDQSRGMGEQDLSSSTRFFHLSMLPKRLQVELVREWNKDGRTRDLEDVLKGAALDSDVSDIVQKGVAKIVQSSSISQSIKGILTAGFVKSLKYSLSKLKKMWKSFLK